MARLSAWCPGDALARLHVDDGLGRPVAESVGRLEIEVPPGRYEVRAVAGGRIASESVAVEDDEPLVARLDLGPFASAAPILRSTTFVAAHAQLLDDALRSGGDGSAVVVMVRQVAGGAVPPVDVRVAPADGVRSLPWTEAAGARCAGVAVAPGLCVVEVGRRSAMAVPIWRGWVSVLVVPVVGDRPVPEHSALHCLPAGTGWADAQAGADVTEQLVGAVRDGIDGADIRTVVEGESPLHHLLRGDADGLAPYDPEAAVARADLAALRIDRAPAAAGDEPPVRVAEPPVLASSADVLLHHEARHPWSIGERLAGMYAARLASAAFFRWQPDGDVPPVAADPKRWYDDVDRFARRSRPARLHRLAVGGPGLEPAGRRLLAHVADRSYARRVQPRDVVREPVGDLVLTTGLPAAALQAGVVGATRTVRRWRRRRTVTAVAAAVVVAAVVAAVVWLASGDGDGWTVTDALAVDEDTPGFIDPLANDEGEGPLTLIGVGDAENGTVTIEGGVIVYSPAPDFSGSDEFTYVADDGTEQEEGRVEVTVRPVNDAPVAVDDAAAAVVGETIDIDVLANDSDPDGDDLRVHAIDDPRGRATATGDGVRITPDEEGRIVLAYEATDGNGAFARAVILVEVAPRGGGDPARAVDDTVETTEATPVDVDVTANDEGLGGETRIVIDEPPAAGEVQVEGLVVRYAPERTFVGTDRFTYRLETGDARSEPATVTVRVLPTILIDDLTTREADPGTASTLVFTVKLSGPSPETVTVSWATVDGTAESGDDFTATSGVLTFEPGQDVAEIPVEILGDEGADEPDETFEVRFSDPVNAAVDPDDGVGTATLLENDSVVVD